MIMRSTERQSRISTREFHDEIRAWCEQVGVEPKRVQIQRMTKKWASCSTLGRLTFSRDLLAEPPRFRVEVVVHELLHLLVPNHGKLFKALMRSYLGREDMNRLKCSNQHEFVGRKVVSPYVSS